jgi:predicted dehydrogenase
MARQNVSRRDLLKSAAAAVAAPYIVPSSVFGADAPSNRIAIGCIGVGRMGTGDLHDVMGCTGVQVIAVCDLDSQRVANAKGLVEKKYGEGCASFGDYRELIARPDIDLVQISTPDHWHAMPAIAAAKAGKDIFIQKPLTYTLEEGRLLSDTVQRYGRILQVGSQQRSDRNFRFACELVRNGRIGKLQTVLIGIAPDVAGGNPTPMPIPANLNYEMWLGPAPFAPYTLDRVHPQGRDGKPDVGGRPGWLRIADYCLGMITGWGAHHNDIAQWGMGTEYTGPTQIVATAEYPKDGLWNVHLKFNIEYTYASGVKVICADTSRNKSGVTFQGSEGWVHVDRGSIDANPKSLLTSVIRPEEIHLPVSTRHKQNLIDAIRTRTQPIAPVEEAHRSCSVCILGYIAMKLGRKLKWDPQKERFTGDDEANRMLSRTNRQPYVM